MELTSAVVSRSITLLNSAALAFTAVMLLLPWKLTPRVLKSAALTAVPAALPPSARANSAEAVVTTVCTSAVVSVAVADSRATALLISARLVVVTPLTPAVL